MSDRIDAVERRLRELARAQALIQHCHQVMITGKHDGHVEALTDANWGFDSCPHLDCAVVRTALARQDARTPPADPPTWQPIATAPKDIAVLVYHFDGWSIAHYNTAYAKWIGFGHDTADTQALAQFPPTHWMPLPAPPSEATAK